MPSTKTTTSQAPAVKGKPAPETKKPPAPEPEHEIKISGLDGEDLIVERSENVARTVKRMLAVTAEENPKPAPFGQDVIKASELKTFLDLNRVLSSAAYGFRKRIAKGASVENSETYSLTCDPYDPEETAREMARPLIGALINGVHVVARSENDIHLPSPELACHDSELLGWALRAHRNFGGCNTPAEEFIVNVLRSYGLRDALTPDSVAGDLETFRDNFKDAIEDARRMLGQYPELVHLEQQS